MVAGETPGKVLPDRPPPPAPSWEILRRVPGFFFAIQPGSETCAELAQIFLRRAQLLLTPPPFGGSFATDWPARRSGQFVKFDQRLTRAAVGRADLNRIVARWQADHERRVAGARIQRKRSDRGEGRRERRGPGVVPRDPDRPGEKFEPRIRQRFADIQNTSTSGTRKKTTTMTAVGAA